MANIQRVALIVLDAVGAGAQADSAKYGDAGANTLKHVVETCRPSIPNLEELGLLATIGLSAKNAILIVEFAKELHDKGGDLIEATIEASRMRLRPILMTSLAFLLGILPLAISTGAGAGGQNAIGTGVMGGTFAATALGIFYIPVFFVVVTSVFSFRWKWKKPKRRRTANIVETIPGDSHK